MRVVYAIGRLQLYTWRDESSVCHCQIAAIQGEMRVVEMRVVYAIA